jgi:hypothetical protein
MMIRLFIPAAVAAISVASSASASPYAFISADAGAAGRLIMADRATIRHEGDLTRVSTYMIFRDVQKGGETYRKVTFEFQCSAGRYRMVGLSAYSDAGVALGGTSEVGPFATTEPDSSLAQLQKETCSPTPLQDTAMALPPGLSDVEIVRDMRKVLTQP